jgi:hypothetical protein
MDHPWEDPMWTRSKIRNTWIRRNFGSELTEAFGGSPLLSILRDAILLVAGDKSGVSEKKFYKRLIEKADKRYKEHLDNL